MDRDTGTGIGVGIGTQAQVSATEEVARVSEEKLTQLKSMVFRPCGAARRRCHVPSVQRHTWNPAFWLIAGTAFGRSGLGAQAPPQSVDMQNMNSQHFFWPERRGNVLCSKCSLRRRSTWDRIFSPPLLSKRTAPKHKDRNVRECEAQSLGEPSGRAEHNLTHQSQGGHKHPAGGGSLCRCLLTKPLFPFENGHFSGPGSIVRALAQPTDRALQTSMCRPLRSTQEGRYRCTNNVTAKMCTPPPGYKACRCFHSGSSSIWVDTTQIVTRNCSFRTEFWGK